MVRCPLPAELLGGDILPAAHLLHEKHSIGAVLRIRLQKDAEVLLTLLILQNSRQCRSVSQLRLHLHHLRLQHRYLSMPGEG